MPGHHPQPLRAVNRRSPAQPSMMQPAESHTGFKEEVELSTLADFTGRARNEADSLIWYVISQSMSMNIGLP